MSNPPPQVGGLFVAGWSSKPQKAALAAPGWTNPEIAAVAVLLLVLLSGTGWLVWDRYASGGTEIGATAGGTTEDGSGGGAPAPGTSAPVQRGQAGGHGQAAGVAAGLDGEHPGNPSAESADIVVHVAGAVKNPGVYHLPQGARVVDALTAAGGQRPDGRGDVLNLAAPLADGDKVYVPRSQEVASGGQSAGPGTAAGGWGQSGAGNGKVDVNHADAAALETLPGVGPALAGAILRYRQDHGLFRNVADLEKVPGIGPAKLAALQDRVVVR